MAQETIAPIAEKVGELAERIQEVNEKTGLTSGPMERALQRLSERMDHLDAEEAPSPEEAHPRHRRSRFARMFNLP